MSEIEEKNCGNCKNYISYYVKDRNRFRNTMLGYCLYEKNFVKSKSRLIAYTTACDLWESNAELLKERKTDVEKAIADISDRLNQLVYILKE